MHQQSHPWLRGRATLGSISAVTAAMQQPLCSSRYALHLPAQTHSMCRMQQQQQQPPTASHTHRLVKHIISAQSLPLTPGPTPVVTPGHKGEQKLFIPFIPKNMQRARENRGLQFLHLTQQPGNLENWTFCSDCIHMIRKSSPERDCGKTRRSWKHMMVMTRVWGSKILKRWEEYLWESWFHAG